MCDDIVYRKLAVNLGVVISHGGESMAIDGIGSVGALNVSSQTRVNRQPEKDIQVSNGTVANQVKVETMQPVVTRNNAGDTKQDKNGRDTGVQSEKEISPEKVKSAVDDINKQIKSNLKHTQCSFKYHEDTNRISITVTDSTTDEVIREIPPEKALDMLAKVWELAGLMVDERR